MSGLIFLMAFASIWIVVARYLQQQGTPVKHSRQAGFLVAIVLCGLGSTVVRNHARAEQHAQQRAQHDAQAVLARQEAAAQRAKDEAACRTSLDCWSVKHQVAAIMHCQDDIEKLAKYQAKWTDGILEAKFSHSYWKNSAHGIVTYSGDKIQFQNGFGAWAVQTYECDYDTLHDTALAVRVHPGRVS